MAVVAKSIRKTNYLGDNLLEMEKALRVSVGAASDIERMTGGNSLSRMMESFANSSPRITALDSLTDSLFRKTGLEPINAVARTLAEATKSTGMSALTENARAMHLQQEKLSAANTLMNSAIEGLNPLNYDFHKQIRGLDNLSQFDDMAFALKAQKSLKASPYADFGSSSWAEGMQKTLREQSKIAGLDGVCFSQASRDAALIGHATEIAGIKSMRDNFSSIAPYVEMSSCNDMLNAHKALNSQLSGSVEAWNDTKSLRNDIAKTVEFGSNISRLNNKLDRMIDQTCMLSGFIDEIGVFNSQKSDYLCGLAFANAFGKVFSPEPSMNSAFGVLNDAYFSHQKIEKLAAASEKIAMIGDVMFGSLTQSRMLSDFAKKMPKMTMPVVSFGSDALHAEMNRLNCGMDLLTGFADNASALAKAFSSRENIFPFEDFSTEPSWTRDLINVSNTQIELDWLSAIEKNVLVEPLSFTVDPQLEHYLGLHLILSAGVDSFEIDLREFKEIYGDGALGLPQLVAIPWNRLRARAARCRDRLLVLDESPMSIIVDVSPRAASLFALLIEIRTELFACAQELDALLAQLG